MAREMYAGHLNRRVVIKEWSESPDLGFSTEASFNELAAVWAKVEPVGAAIYQSSVQIDKAVTHRFIVRRQVNKVEAHAITNKHVVEYNNWRYRVKRAAELADEREFIVIETEELGEIEGEPV